ncbi:MULTISPECIES: Fic family protein [unclassified Oceanispirochaeta]|uniref:Fic family protein n=1 Tax=unclassified Oceanispirochaeta TaxID=2635722 RepID=UPI000E09CABC|nr:MULTISPECIES: Fic family protein [unclassified Oceanispirochaeta]MBF9018945.1 Fic family protein [Oceanispirochaeta sp. M2]NPD75442.1 Fic family protein [Oceanispirochaeta sp. M1]RDG28710.1 Fic family protein [Oceanispirochaeta sp. M1]
MNDKLLSSIVGKKKELDSHRPLNASIVRKLHEQFALEWTYNSNAIEGNTLSLQETEIVLNSGITIGGKTVNEHLEAINHKEGIFLIEKIIKNHQELSEFTIKEIHRVILKGIDDLEAGCYRRTNVRIVGARMIPPQTVKLNKLMAELLTWYYENLTVLPIPELAAQFHYRFVCIHPFIDGNGRVARLLMNLILMRNGFPPTVILKVDRKKYYRVLNEGNLGNLNPFIDFVGRAIERSLIIYLNSIIPNTSEKQGFINLREASKYCDYSQEYLSFLARKGKLSAIKMNKEWVTTREAIEEYVKELNMKDEI